MCQAGSPCKPWYGGFSADGDPCQTSKGSLARIFQHFLPNSHFHKWWNGLWSHKQEAKSGFTSPSQLYLFWVHNFRFYWIHGWAQCSVQSHVDWMAQVWVKNLAHDSWVQFGVQVIKMRKRRSLTWPIWTPSTNSTRESVCFINQSLIWQTDQGKRASFKKY